MKSMSCWGALLAVVALPVLADCPPSAMLCASPIVAAQGGNNLLHLNEQDPLLWQSGMFSLERVDGRDGNRFGIRPSLQLDNHTRLSFRLNKSKAELRLRVTW
ncbi:hypothetical protein [Vogesella oryzae]|uniref:hypothetical protein n=1 Tax=Vogesella oryzae TaxID=1735285 RepID=UPI0015835CAC|nr:hypothetical protein [Vogesella oryzae]